MLLVLLLVGCGDGSITLGEKDGAGPDDTGADDTDPGDTDPGDTDPGDTDAPADERFSGTFAGSADIHSGDGGGPDGGGGMLLSCEGPFELVLGADGAWAGTAECVERNGGNAFTGPIDGVSDGARLVGRFVYDGFGFHGEADVTLLRADAVLDGTVQDQDRGIAMSLLARGALDTP